MKRNRSTTLKNALVVAACALGVVAGLTQSQALAQQTRSTSASRSSRPRLLRGNVSAGPGAFVDRPVDTTDELLAVLQTDKAARQRYAKHFGVSEDKVVSFIKSALVVTPLDRKRTVTNYYVAQNGVIKSHREVMPKGTKVWSTRAGLPILKWICANPLTKRLPGGGVVLTTPPERSPRTGTPVVTSPPPQSAGLDNQVAVPDIDATTPPLVLTDDAIASATSYSSAPVPLSSVIGGAPVSIGGAGGIGGLPFSLGAGGLLATPFLIPLITGGGGGGGFNAGGGGNIVPEPTTAALLGATVPFLVGLHRRRRRAKR